MTRRGPRGRASISPPGEFRAGRRRLLSASALVLLALGGCTRKAADPASLLEPWTGPGPVTIRGVRPGQDEAEVVALLGAPDRRDGTEYQPVSLQWQRFPDMVVSVDRRTRRVSDVLGSQLDAAGGTVVSHGMSGADVRAVLGEPAKSQGHYRPSGSGVISLGVKRDAETLAYRRDGAEIEITLNDDSLAYIPLRPEAR